MREVSVAGGCDCREKQTVLRITTATTETKALRTKYKLLNILPPYIRPLPTHSTQQTLSALRGPVDYAFTVTLAFSSRRANTGSNSAPLSFGNTEHLTHYIFDAGRKHLAKGTNKGQVGAPVPQNGPELARAEAARPLARLRSHLELQLFAPFDKHIVLSFE